MRQLFQALLRTRDGAFIMNEKNKIIFWNRAAEAILGYSAEEVEGKLCYEILGGLDEQGRTLCQRYCRLSIRADQGKTLPSIDVLAQTRSDQRRWINVTTLALSTDEPETGNMIVHLFRDANDHKNHEHFIETILEAARGLRDKGEQPGVFTPAAEPAPDPHFQRLTLREREVLHLLAHGLGTEEMADALSISPATTRNHVQHILDKLKVHTRLEAVAYAYQRGLIDVDH